jgi:hypothetical protein
MGLFSVMQIRDLIGARMKIDLKLSVVEIVDLSRRQPITANLLPPQPGAPISSMQAPPHVI